MKPNEVMFVSSNPFDACGAKAYGLNVAWIERVTPMRWRRNSPDKERVPPLAMFKATRTQMDELGFQPDHRINGLRDCRR